MASTVVFIGPPGCGKGTHAARLSKEYKILPVSVGEYLRREVKAKTELGVKIADIISRGELVSDEIAVEVVKGVFYSNRDKNILLDGFPRTVTQAVLLDEVLLGYKRQVDIAVYFKVSDKEVIRRISGRRMDPVTGKIYHIEFNPPPEGVNTIQRDDDRIEVIKKRLELFHKETAPVADYYKKQKKIAEIDGEGKPDEVYSRLLSAIKQYIE